MRERKAFFFEVDFLHDLELSYGSLVRTHKVVLSAVLIFVALHQEGGVNVVEAELSKIQNEWFPHWVIGSPIR